MRRKLIQQGNRSVTLTLPIHWARERGLDCGGEIEIVPSGDHLVIGAKHSPTRRKISLQLNRDAGAAVRKLLGILYRAGYDEVSLRFPTGTTKTYLQEMIWNELVGFEMEPVDDNTVIIRDIADLDPESFPILFKKSFLLLLTMCDELQHALRHRQPEILKQIIFKDQEINKITNLALRLLNKKMNDRRKIITFAYILKTIEKLGDCFKDLAEAGLSKTAPFNAEELSVLEKLTGKLRETYNLYSRFDLVRILTINEEIRVLRKQMEEKRPQRQVLWRFFHSITHRLETLTEGAISLNIEGKKEMVQKEDWVA